MDRRKSARLEIQLSARFALRRIEGYWFTGHTLNMSRSGVLVEAADPGIEIEPTDEVDLELDLAEIDGAQPRCLRCSGIVVRTADNGGRKYFALAIRRMDFRIANLRQ